MVQSPIFDRSMVRKYSTCANKWSKQRLDSFNQNEAVYEKKSLNFDQNVVIVPSKKEGWNSHTLVTQLRLHRTRGQRVHYFLKLVKDSKVRQVQRFGYTLSSCV